MNEDQVGGLELWRIKNSHQTRMRARQLADEELRKLGRPPMGVAPYEQHIAALLAALDAAHRRIAELEENGIGNGKNGDGGV